MNLESKCKLHEEIFQYAEFLNLKSKIFNLVWNLKKKGYTEDTLRNSFKALIYLSKNCNLDDSEKVKGFIAGLGHSPSWKKTLCRIYGYYAEQYGISGYVKTLWKST